MASISDAEKRMTEWNKTTSLPDFILDSLEQDSRKAKEGIGRVIFGSADEYHNLASEFARNSLYRGATIIAASGAKLYQYNVDLLADIIKFSSKTQDWQTCEKAVERIKKVPRARWGWRAYTFLIDYLFDRLEASEPNNYEAIENEIMKYISAYKKLGDERAWVAESELYLGKGEKEKAIDILKQGVESVRVVPQICVKLSDLLLKEGSYEDVVKYSAIGIRSTAEEQPSASTGYLVYVSALAKDAIIHEEEQKMGDNPDKGFGNNEKVASALSDYELAKDLLGNKVIYAKNIEQRIKILRKKSSLPDKNEQEDYNLRALLEHAAMIRHHENSSNTVMNSDYRGE